MERRRALVVAGTLTATLAMAGTAMAVNLGLLASDADTVGNLSATELQPATERQPDRVRPHRRPRVRVIVQDIPVAAGGASAGSGGSWSSGAVESSGAPAPTSAASSAPAPAASPTVDPAPAPPPAPAPGGGDDDGYDDDHGDDHGDDHAEDPEDPEVPGDDD